MQETSALWKSIWATGQAQLESKAYINGTEYTQISSPVISRAALLNSLTVGNASSATCEFTVRTNDNIPKGAEVIIVQRLVYNNTASEWLPAGTFYISHRSKDPINGLLSLECYDGLLKTNIPMPTAVPWTDNNGNFITTNTGEILYISTAYPVSMKVLLDDLLYVLGMELDPRTTIATGSQYVIESVNSGMTVNDVLKQIAAANGGNWIMTPRNKLRLVPVVSASGASSSTENVVDVVAVTSAISNTDTRTVTGVAYEGQNGRVVVGDETGIVIDADVSEAVATALASRLVGMTYQAFDLSGAIYDPAAEIGDYVRSRSDVASVLYSETATLGVMFRGRISAPELGELADEYPYKGAAQKSYDRAKSYADAAAQIAAQNAVNNLDLTLTQQEIFDRLTDGGLEQGISLQSMTNPGPSAAGERKIFLNLDYARFGKLVADFIQGGTLTLGGLDNVNGTFIVLDGDGNEVGRFDSDGLDLSQGNIDLDSGSQIRIAFDTDSQRYALFNSNGMRLRLDSGAMVATSTYRRNNSSLFPSGVDLGSLAAFYDGQSYYLQTTVAPGAISSIRTTNSASEYTYSLLAGIDRLSLSKLRQDGNGTSHSFSVHIDLATPIMEWTGNTLFSGDFTVSGTKSRVVETDQYANRLLYCYETPTPMFGDVGEGEIGEDGLCYIWLDPVFAQTITTNQYQVFLQPYGQGACWVDRRDGGCFVVGGEPGLKFGWEIKAKQRDYDQRRLERDEAPFAVPEQTYGADAAQYIDELTKGRVTA